MPVRAAWPLSYQTRRRETQWRASPAEPGERARAARGDAECTRRADPPAAPRPAGPRRAAPGRADHG